MFFTKYFVSIDTAKSYFVQYFVKFVCFRLNVLMIRKQTKPYYSLQIIPQLWQRLTQDRSDINTYMNTITSKISSEISH